MTLNSTKLVCIMHLSTATFIYNNNVKLLGLITLGLVMETQRIQICDVDTNPKFVIILNEV